MGEIPKLTAYDFRSLGEKFGGAPMDNEQHEKSSRFRKKIRFGGKVFLISENVYEPAEDSFLIAKQMKTKGSVLDMGTGCGILSILAACGAERVVAIDVNPYAARCAKVNAEVNGVSEKIDVLIGDLFNPLKEKPVFDVILFNAPYLPIEEESERKEDLIDYAWSGGKDGRRVIDRFIQQVSKYLKKNGRVLLVQSSLSNVKRTLEKLRKQGFQVRIVDEKKAFFESITLIEAVKL